MNYVDVFRSVLGHDGKPTLGSILYNDQIVCESLERPVNGPHPCVPAGEYDLVEDWHHPLDLEKRYRVPELRGVPGRSDCQIHIANRVDQIEGCIATGTVSADRSCVESSGDAFRALKARIEYPCRIRIHDPA